MTHNMMTWPWRKPDTDTDNFDGDGGTTTANSASRNSNETVGTHNPSRDNAFTYEDEAHRRDHGGGDQGVEVGNSDVPHMNVNGSSLTLSGVDTPDNFYEGEDEDDGRHAEVVLEARRMRGHVAAMCHSSQKTTKALIGLSLFISVIIFSAGIGGIVSHNKEVTARNFAVRGGEDCLETSMGSKVPNTGSKTKGGSKPLRRLQSLRGMNGDIEVKQVPMNLKTGTNKRDLAPRELKGSKTSSKGSKKCGSKSSKGGSSMSPTPSPTSLPYPPLVWKGVNGCTPESPCGVCTGDCDSNEECMPGLECLKRSGSEQVPGCTLGGIGDTPGADYCYDPSAREPPSATPTSAPTAAPSSLSIAPTSTPPGAIYYTEFATGKIPNDSYWTTSKAPWIIDTERVQSGKFSIRSADLESEELTPRDSNVTFTTRDDFPAGTLVLNILAGTRLPFDDLLYFVDGVIRGQLECENEGETDFKSVTIGMGPGRHEIEFSYKYNPIGLQGFPPFPFGDHIGAVFIDNVYFLPEGV